MEDDSKFERELACYDQNFSQFRSLNEQMIKIPTIAVTITGGLWFIVGANPELAKGVAFIFLLFAGLINIGLGVSCIRIRDVMNSYQEKIQEFSSSHYADGVPKEPVFSFLRNYSMIIIYSSLMATAGVLSFFLAIEFYWPFELISQLDHCTKLIVRIASYGSILLFYAIIIRRVWKKRANS